MMAFKRYLILLFLAAIIPNATARVAISAENVPCMALQQESHDFGKIPEGKDKVGHDFVFTNTGNCPLVVTKAVVSCKCVDVSYSKKPVPPGGKGVISVTYNPKKQQGMMYKAIQIFSNDPRGNHVIIIKGKVVAVDK